MDTLRVSCPWDARQTHESLAPHLLEECYEALDALEGGDPAALRDELGDVLLQVVFHARIASEAADGTGYTIDDVAEGIVAKRNWDAIKAAERAEAAGAPVSVLDTVPFGQPALSLAAQLQRRAERAGVPTDLADLPGDGFAGAGGPAEGDRAARRVADGEGDGAAGGQAVSDIGAELFALVARAREAGLDPELELRAAARAYRDRVRAWERSE